MVNISKTFFVAAVKYPYIHVLRVQLRIWEPMCTTYNMGRDAAVINIISVSADLDYRSVSISTASCWRAKAINRYTFEDSNQQIYIYNILFRMSILRRVNMQHYKDKFLVSPVHFYDGLSYE